MNNLPNILFRVDANEKVALGHLKRCISLSLKLREFNANSYFAIIEDGYSKRLLSSLSIPFFSIDIDNPIDDLSQTLIIAKNVSANIIVTDSYTINDGYRKKLIDNGYFVVSLSDLSIDVNDYNININSNLNAEKIIRIDNNKDQLLGIDYLIMPIEFWNISNYNSIDKIENVLITMGGIDHFDLTTQILIILDKINSPFSITVIIGPYYENIDSINNQANKMNKSINIISNPNTLFPFMEKCTLALCAGGQTLYELLSLGRPTIGISLWKNQEGNINELSKIGGIRGISYNEEHFNDKLSKEINDIVFNISLRQKMFLKSKQIVDGKGADRVSNKILNSYQNFILDKEGEIV